MGVFPASEAGFREGFVQSYACCLVLLQSDIEDLGVADGLAGVPDGDAFHLVWSRSEMGWDCLDDGSLDLLPVGGGIRLSQRFDGLVVAPAGGVKPEFDGFLLFPVGIDPDPFR